MPSTSLVALAVALAVAPAVAGPAPTQPKPKLYTTYFYTAGEAIVQGYEADTHVRIISLNGKKGTLWEGTVHRGDATVVKTGMGAFGFLSDKKASILVGTPQSCTCVGYFGKDETGSFRSNHMFLQTPPAASTGKEKVVVWAMEDLDLEVRAPRKEKLLKKATLKKGEFVALTSELNEAIGATLELVASKGTFTAQAYWDEGFTVPADNGTAGGRSFHTYVGTITNGVNDLNVLAPRLDAKVTVTDLVAKKVLFKGVVKGGGAKTLTLADKFVSVESDVSVNVVVAALEHEKTGYAEHHFAAGLEGTQIDNEFLVTTSGELWVFSYYDGNEVTVKDTTSGALVFSGKLGAGQVKGLTPGHGLFQVRGSRGLSTMGGASSCGADYSPAGGLFAIDEAVLEVVAQIREERVREAAAQGRTLTTGELNAPVNDTEWKKHQKTFQDAYGQKLRPRGVAAEAAPASAAPMSLDEFNQRSAAH
ncbi:MAG: hypothetical protein JNJ54_08135 [Myxococcaceae bacterium]|nr:hypothetical protein [Myxococcaceae bacterium]